MSLLLLFGSPAGGSVTGTGAITLGSVTVAGSGNVGRTGSGAITLGAVTVAGSGKVGRTGTGVITLGAIQVAGVGERSVTGSGAITLGSITVAGAGAVSTGASTITGTGAIVLGSVQVAGTGKVGRTGTGAIALGAVQVAGTGTVNTTVTGTGAITLGAMQVAGLGEGVVVATPVRETPAGRRTRRRRYAVEIDGQEFIVESVEQAQALLERARAMARQAAEAQAEKVVARAIAKARGGTPPPVQLNAPSIKVDPEIAPALASKREEIRAVYREVRMEAELRLLLQLEQERDDEEVLLLL